MRRQAIIGLGLRALAAVRAGRWLPQVTDARGFVVTLHHVEPPRLSHFAPNAHLSITPEFLEAFILRLKEQGRRFVPLDDLIAAGAKDGSERRVAITLDDGFRDNLRHAWPVFARHSVPFAIYVCPCFCDRSAELWWEALERIVAGTAELSLPGEGAPPVLATRSREEKMRAYRRWAEWLTTGLDEAGQRETIRRLAERYGVDLRALAADLVMDWDEIRQIAADPLCTIGAHTMTHPALARLSPQAAFREMQDSADRIETELGVRPGSIAFPYGYKAAAGDREARLAEQAGFAASFTTRPGYVSAAGPRHGLPRVSVNGLYQYVDLLEVLLTPGLWKLRSNLKRSS